MANNAVPKDFIITIIYLNYNLQKRKQHRKFLLLRQILIPTPTIKMITQD